MIKKYFTLKSILIVFITFGLITAVYDLIQKRELDYIGIIIKSAVFSILFNLLMKYIKKNRD